jgi:hypothetical protein
MNILVERFEIRKQSVEVLRYFFCSTVLRRIHGCIPPLRVPKNVLFLFFAGIVEGDALACKVPALRFWKLVVWPCLEPLSIQLKLRIMQLLCRTVYVLFDTSVSYE